MDEGQRVEPGRSGAVEISLDLPSIEFDWVAYFRGFSARHGGHPVKWTDRLILFRDGWTYSAFNYEGPEYPPPREPEKMHSLQVSYWSARETELSALRESIFLTVERIKNLVTSRDAPLQQVITVLTDRGGFERRTVPLNLTEWTHRLDAVESLLGEARRNLRILAETKRPILY